MRDLPILFSASMVRAILREIEQPGTGKAQTRRVINPQPKLHAHHEPVCVEKRGERGWVWMVHTDRPSYQYATGDWKAPYAVGDRLYAREAWRCGAVNDYKAPRDLKAGSFIAYEADGPHECAPLHGRFRQGMHMPRWASRITLIVTVVRVQRLQEISEQDAIAEGVEQDSDGWRDYQMPATQCCASACASFQSLWDSINGDRPGAAWRYNPWVVAISFQPVLGNIDQVKP